LVLSNIFSEDCLILTLLYENTTPETYAAVKRTAAADNIFIFKNKTLLTPSLSLGALEGITLNTVIDLAAKNKTETKYAFLTKYDLYNADECFITGTGAEIIPVIKIDGRLIGKGNPGNETKKLIKQFHEFVNY